MNNRIINEEELLIWEISCSRLSFFSWMWDSKRKRYQQQYWSRD